MIRKLLLLFLLLGAQNFYSQTSCGTPQSAVQNFQGQDTPFSGGFFTCVNVQFHVVRMSDGTGGVNESYVNQITDLLNGHFNPHGIYINKSGVDYISNSGYYNMNDSSFNSLIATNNNPNAVNFYLVNSSSWAGKAQEIPSKNLVLVNSFALSGVAAHELGHCLNLWHTFQGTKAGTSGCAEFISGSNCISCGDYVCDTPADADIANTGGYNPDMTNNMSYYAYSTLDHFTAQQGSRMRNALNSSPLLQTVLSTSCSNLAGAGNICAESPGLYTLINPQNIPVSWSTSSNLQIISSSNNAVTVQAVNANVNGKENVTAVINGIVLQKTVWIGKPNITIYQPPVSTCNPILQLRSGVSNATLQEQGITDVRWIRNDEEISGNNYNFNVNYDPIMIKVTNSCGTTIYYPFIPLVLPERCGVGPIQRLSSNSESKTYYKIYPNPSSEIINIRLNTTKKISNINSFASLYDLNGIKRKYFEIIDSNTTVNINDLSPGIYVLRINIDEKEESHQIIIN